VSAYLTVDQVAKDLQLSPNTIRNWIKSGKLPAFKLTPGITAPLRIRRDDLDALVEAGRVRPSA
jgi:excisionase family DNA binding protein